MDGLDVALVEIAGNPAHPEIFFRAFAWFPFPLDLAGHCRKLSKGVLQEHISPEGREVKILDEELGDWMGTCIQKFLAAEEVATVLVRAVGSHGQTILHCPPKVSIQLGNPEKIAEKTGLPVISDFRRADMDEGGQGAPLVPLLDYYCFAHPTLSRVLVNIGGIANISYLPASCQKEEVLGFDCGPGNYLMDTYFRLFPEPNFPEIYSSLTLKTHMYTEAVAIASLFPFFSQSYPKSADVEDFDSLFSLAQSHGIDREHTLSLLAFITAFGIFGGISLLPNYPDEIWLTGGGAKNPFLQKAIENVCRFPILVYELLPCEHPKGQKIPQKSKEAILFAVLAHHFIYGKAGNLPQVTGARHPVVLGKITYPPNRFKTSE